jgi:uncharacterized protein GlcG (DUF336 family)
MIRIQSAAVLLLVSLSGTVAAQTATYTTRTLTLDAARELALATLDACRKAGHRVTITVLDNRGATKLVISEDGANPHTVENSMRKAYTSLTSRRPSGEYGKRLVSNPQSIGALQLDRITTLEGALPIFAGKDIVGSVGVSGAPGGDKDAACAQAGIDRIAAGLK